LQQELTIRNEKIGTQNGCIAIFGCQLLSQSPGNTFIELAVVEISKFAVGILILSVLVPEIKKYFRFWQPHYHFQH